MPKQVKADVDADQQLTVITPESRIVLPTKDLPRNISIRDCPHNLPLDTPEGRRLAFNCGNPADIVIDPQHIDDKGRPYIVIRVRYYIGYPEDFVNPDTGEVTEGTRYCFITTNGETYKTSSGHAWQRVKAMLELFMPHEWEQGIPIRITERKSRNPQRQSPYHDIRLEQ
jgi:hypothetical protein